MRRLLPEGQSAPVLSVATLVTVKYSDTFEPIRNLRPKIDILSRRTARYYLGRTEGEDEAAVLNRVLSKVYEGLRESGSHQAKASYEDVDFFGDTLAIVLDSPRVSGEIDFAYEVFEQESHGISIDEDRRPRFPLGYFPLPFSPETREQVLNTVSEFCAEQLPTNRRMLLDPIIP